MPRVHCGLYCGMWSVAFGSRWRCDQMLESFICEETLIRWSTSEALLSLLLGGDPLSTQVGEVMC